MHHDVNTYRTIPHKHCIIPPQTHSEWRQRSEVCLYMRFRWVQYVCTIVTEWRTINFFVHASCFQKIFSVNQCQDINNLSRNKKTIREQGQGHLETRVISGFTDRGCPSKKQSTLLRNNTAQLHIVILECDHMHAEYRNTYSSAVGVFKATRKRQGILVFHQDWVYFIRLQINKCINT